MQFGIQPLFVLVSLSTPSCRVGLYGEGREWREAVSFTRLDSIVIDLNTN